MLRLFLAAALLAPTITALPASVIFARADTCTVSCGSDLPASLCCTKGTTCTVLAGGTTVVCCPTSRDCETIQPVTCDVTQQNGTAHPGSSIKTTVFNVALESCGSQCCPFGYSCSNSTCVQDSDQSEAPSASSSTTSAGSSATSVVSDGASTATGATTATDAATATDVSSTDATVTDPAASTDATAEGSSSEDESGSKDSKSSGPATTSIVGGVVGACIGLLIIGIIIFCCIRRKKKSDAVRSEKSGHAYHGRSPSSTGSFGNIISEPIAQPNSYRTDFIRKSPSATTGTVTGSTPSTSTPSQSSPLRTSYSTLARHASTVFRGISEFPPRISINPIPNRFNSPNPSPKHNSIQPSPVDDEIPRHGTVRLAPIYAGRAYSHYSHQANSPITPTTPELQREPSSESINVFAEPGTVKSRPLTRGTTFTDLMDEADLAAVRHGKPYVPETPPNRV